MKVLLMVTSLTMGGAEKVVVDLADGLVRTGCEVLLVHLKKPLQIRPRQPEVEVVCLGMESVKNVFSGYLRFRRIVRDFKPDIVHSHLFPPNMLARLSRLSISIPCVISTMHSAYDGWRLQLLAYRVTDRLADISTNVSCEAVDAYMASRAVGAGRMVAIHNGIAVDEFRASPEARTHVRDSLGIGAGCKVLLAVGRLCWSKDYPNMFKALARLPEELEFKLLIAGEGAFRQPLEALVAELGLSSRVRFLGVRDDIADLMSAADVFVLSSVVEGFGLVVAEAMACECVVVATDSGGIREVLGDAGFLVPSQDPAALADAVLAANALTRGDAAELGKAARRRVVETYSFDRAMEKWHELYGRLMARRQHATRAGRLSGPIAGMRKP